MFKLNENIIASVKISRFSYLKILNLFIQFNGKFSTSEFFFDNEYSNITLIVIYSLNLNDTYIFKKYVIIIF